MVRRLFCAVSLSLMLCAAGTGAAQNAPSMKDEVVVGILTDMTSVYSDLVGPGSVLAAQMAVEDFTRDETPAFKVRILSADHGSKADVASNIARNWFDTEGVDVIADVAGASVTLAVSKLGAQKNKVVLATASGQNSLSREDCQATTLHWTYNTAAVSGVNAKTVTQEGGDAWYFLTADYAGGRSLQEDATAAIKAAGGTVIGSVLHPLGNHDFSSALLLAQDPRVKVIGLANAGADTVTSIKQAAEYGMLEHKKLSAMLMYITDVHAVGLPLTKGMYVTSPFYWDLNDDSRAWSKRFFAKHGKMPTMVQAGLYSAVLHYLKAVKSAQTMDAPAVIAKMRAERVNDMFVKSGYLREDNLLIHDMYTFRIKSPEESKYDWDYYDLVRSVPGEEAFPAVSPACKLVSAPGK